METTTPASHEAGTQMSPAEALLALLIASARADGAVSPHEANQIEHIVSTMKLFRGTTLESRHTLIVKAADRIKELGIHHVVDEAVSRIPKELAKTAFALAVDLMLTDGRLTAREQGYADELRDALNVDPEMAGRIIDVLTIKNAG